MTRVPSVKTWMFSGTSRLLPTTEPSSLYLLDPHLGLMDHWGYHASYEAWRTSQWSKAYTRSFRIGGRISVPGENRDSRPGKMRSWVLTCFVFEELGALVDLLMEICLTGMMMNRTQLVLDITSSSSLSLCILLPRFHMSSQGCT